MMRGLTLFGMGAGLMYFFDPDRGRSRRALIREQFQSGLRQLDDALDVAVRDLSNRTRGLASELEHTFTGDEPVADRVLVDRVRATMGRYVSHPRALVVEADQGQIRLRGPILAA